MTRRLKLFVIAIVAVAIGTACTDTESGSPLLGAPTLDPIASDYQTQILADGTVTYAEYERATFDMISCLMQQGIPVNGPFENETTGGVVLDFEYGDLPAGASSEEVEAQDGIFDSCRSEYLDHVTDTYLEGISPTEEELQRREESRRACVSDLGFDVPSGMSTIEFYELVSENLSAVVPCLERYP